MNLISLMRCHLESIVMLTPMWKSRYNDVIMTSQMASQITSLTIVYSIVYSRHRSKKTPKPRVTGLCAGNSPVTGEFPAQRTSNAENVSICWRHHARSDEIKVVWTGFFISHWHFSVYFIRYTKKGDWDAIFTGKTPLYVRVVTWVAKTCHLLWCWNILELPASLPLTNIVFLTHWPPGDVFKLIIEKSSLVTHREIALKWMSTLVQCNGLVSSGNKPLPEPMLTQLHVAIWRH